MGLSRVWRGKEVGLWGEVGMPFFPVVFVVEQRIPRWYYETVKWKLVYMQD